MRFPFTVDGHDVVVSAPSGDVSIAETATAVTGSPPADSWGGALVGGRPVRLDDALVDARVRPGDEVIVSSHPVVPVAPSGWAVHVLAGVDAGRVLPITSEPGMAITVGRGRAMHVRLASNAVSSHQRHGGARSADRIEPGTDRVR
jgi:hypothetical protein